MSVISANRAYNFSGMTILIVDANDFARSFTRNICRGFRFGEIVTAKDPVEALGYLKGKVIDIVLTEWAFRPVNGASFIRHVRASDGILNPYVPVIVLTACTELETVAQARDAGSTEFLTRPLVLGRLLARLTHALSAPRPFVRSATYFGPDRRRRQRPFDGPDRRGAAAPARLVRSSLAQEVSEKVLRAGGLTIDQMIAAGDQIVAEEAGRYREVRRADLQELVMLVKEMKASETPHPEIFEHIYVKALDLKGMGETFGYQLLTRSGDSLCALLWNLSAAATRTAIVRQGIEAHVMVMSLILEREIENDGGPLGGELIASLQTLVARARGIAPDLAD